MIDKKVPWSEVQGKAHRLFNIWASGGDIEWAEEAWGHLAAAGQTAAECHVDRTRVLLRLLTLAMVYDQFCLLMWDEMTHRDLAEFTVDFEVDTLSLGILAAPMMQLDDGKAEDAYELRLTAFGAVTGGLRKEVWAALVKAYGDERALFERLAKTTLGLVPEDGFSHSNPYEDKARSMPAYQFVCDGFE